MERYKELEIRLGEILTHLDEQLNELNSTTDANFHSNLINIIAEYPNFKELIQFVVAINDKQETKNEIFKDVIYDSIKDIVHVKQQAVIELIKELKALEDFKTECRNTHSAQTKIQEPTYSPIIQEPMKQLLKQDEQKSLNSLTQYIKELLTPKIILITLATILGIIAFFIMPDQVILLAKAIFGKGV